MLDFVLRADREEGGDVVGDVQAMDLVRRGAEHVQRLTDQP